MKQNHNLMERKTKLSKKDKNLWERVTKQDKLVKKRNKFWQKSQKSGESGKSHTLVTKSNKLVLKSYKKKSQTRFEKFTRYWVTSYCKQDTNFAKMWQACEKCQRLVTKCHTLVKRMPET